MTLLKSVAILLFLVSPAVARNAPLLAFNPPFTLFPGHRILIADHGVYLVENLNREELGQALAERRRHEFVLVLNPLRIKGATASPLNAFALLP